MPEVHYQRLPQAERRDTTSMYVHRLLGRVRGKRWCRPVARPRPSSRTRDRDTDSVGPRTHSVGRPSPQGDTSCLCSMSIRVAVKRMSAANRTLDVGSRRVIGWAMATHMRDQARRGRAGDGSRTPSSRGSCRASFRQGLAVHFSRLRGALPRVGQRAINSLHSSVLRTGHKGRVCRRPPSAPAV